MIVCTFVLCVLGCKWTLYVGTREKKRTIETASPLSGCSSITKSFLLDNIPTFKTHLIVASTLKIEKKLFRAGPLISYPITRNHVLWLIVSAACSTRRTFWWERPLSLDDAGPLPPGDDEDEGGDDLSLGDNLFG